MWATFGGNMFIQLRKKASPVKGTSLLSYINPFPLFLLGLKCKAYVLFVINPFSPARFHSFMSDSQQLHSKIILTITSLLQPLDPYPTHLIVRFIPCLNHLVEPFYNQA